MRRRGFTLIELMVCISIIAILSGLLMSAAARVRAAAARVRCQSNLRQIALALHHLHDVRGRFPSGNVVVSTNGECRYLGWQFPLLPYIEQNELWRQSMIAVGKDPFPFHVPPHVGLGTRIPAFNCPLDSRVDETPILKGHPTAFTSYLGVTGLDNRARSGILFPGSRIRIVDVTDGTSNTAMLGERPPSASLLLGWWYAGAGQDGFGSADMHLGVRERRRMHPDLLLCNRGPYHFQPGSLDNDCDALHFWSLHAGGANFAFADGSVHFLRYAADQVLPALATRSGGEVASWDE